MIVSGIVSYLFLSLALQPSLSTVEIICMNNSTIDYGICFRHEHFMEQMACMDLTYTPLTCIFTKTLEDMLIQDCESSNRSNSTIATVCGFIQPTVSMRNDLPCTITKRYTNKVDVKLFNLTTTCIVFLIMIYIVGY